MPLVWNTGAALNVGSGLLVALLGAGLLWARPRKDWNRIFGLFAIFWGVQIIGLNAVRLASDPSTAALAGRIGLAFLVPLYFFLVLFAAIFPRPRPPFGTSGLAVALLVLPAATALVLLFVRPTTLVLGVHPLPSGGYTMRWGPLLPYVVALPFFAAFLFALFAMMRRLDEAAAPIERQQVVFVLTALGLFVAYNTPIQLWSFGRAALGLAEASEAATGEARALALILLASLALLVLLGVRLWRRARGASGPEAREAARSLSALAAAFAAALLIIVLGAVADARLDLLGLVRILAVALIVYAVARYQLFELDLRLKQGIALAVALLAGGAVAYALWAVLEQARLGAAVIASVAAVAAVAAFVPLLRVAYRLLDRVAPQVSPAGDHLYVRKLEVYRAGVEEVLRDRREPRPDEPRLADLRARLGLAERDHQVAVRLADLPGSERGDGDLRPGAVVFDKYAIDSLLGEGGFGRVFLARDLLLRRPVVLKELQAKWRGDPASVRSLLREAQIAGQLNHPNLVSVHAVERRGDDYYLVLEHVPGGTLEERLRTGRVPPAEAVRIARALLDGLGAAHARGVVHRDVKPGNVLFGGRGEVKLADFGIALLGPDESEATVTGLAEPVPRPGTLQYMSPEQARGDPVDARTDLYAVGALLYRMLAGRPHVSIRGLDELAARAAIDAAPSPQTVSGAPPELNAVMARALSPDPASRFGSAPEFAAALEAAAARTR